MSNFGMSFPALNGEIVMQGHADYCAEHGHATHTVTDLEGKTTVSERCPRCGASILDRFDMAAAWQFVLDSYDGSGFSPARRDWTDGEILAFVAEHHVDGIAAVFTAKPEQAPVETEQGDETPAPTFKLIGENTLTGNTWDCETGIATRAEADQLRKGWQRLESDYKIEYRVEEVPAR